MLYYARCMGFLLFLHCCSNCWNDGCVIFKMQVECLAVLKIAAAEDLMFLGAADGPEVSTLELPYPVDDEA